MQQSHCCAGDAASCDNVLFILSSSSFAHPLCVLHKGHVHTVLSSFLCELSAVSIPTIQHCQQQCFCLCSKKRNTASGLLIEQAAAAVSAMLQLNSQWSCCGASHRAGMRTRATPNSTCSSKTAGHRVKFVHAVACMLNAKAGSCPHDC